MAGEVFRLLERRLLVVELRRKADPALSYLEGLRARPTAMLIASPMDHQNLKVIQASPMAN